MVQLLSETCTHPAHRELDPRGLPAGGNPVGVEVVVPGQLNADSIIVAPAATAANWRLAPECGPESQYAVMHLRVTPVMQHESPEAASGYDVGHAVHIWITHCLRKNPRWAYGLRF